MYINYQLRYNSESYLFIGILWNTIHSALNDEGFHLPSPTARQALHTASKILDWSCQTVNTSEFTYAAVQLSEKLLKIVKKTSGKKSTNERMFITLFDYIQSDEYIHLWTTVTAAASTTPSRLL